MNAFPEYEDYDALGLAELVREGKVTAAELCEEAIRRAEAVEPHLNAIITPMYDEARRVARAAPAGPFGGVPFLLKDLLQAYQGAPLTFGSEALRDYVPDHDSELVRRFKAAGLVTMGKTNVPEFGLLGVTEPEAFGPTRNPWDLERTPGGSSGGSAAAVAARVVPVAHASDGGGSIRIPAAHCGLFGLKTTRGRVPVGPDYGEIGEGTATEFAVTRSVRDAAALLDAVQGGMPGAPYIIAPPEKPYAEAIQRPPRWLRIGFNVEPPLASGTVDAECVRAVEHAARLLEDLGHHVEEAAPEVDGRQVAHAYVTMYFGQVAATLDWLRSERGPEAERQVEYTTRALATVGRSLPAGAYVAARWQWNAFARAMAAYHERYDLYLTPTTAGPPVQIGALEPSHLEALALRSVTALRAGRVLLASGIIGRVADRSLRETPFTQVANLTGQPAVSVPLHWTEDGLPVGVHFVAPFGREDVLLQLGRQLEEAQPWDEHRPGLLRQSTPAHP